jgi:UDP-3-O-[3-hydroxymyristoyl] glucosamine N-acyltransferase
MRVGGSSRFKLSDLATRFGVRLIGDPALEIVAVKNPDIAGAGDLTFWSHANQWEAVRETKATALLTSTSVAADQAHELPCAVLAAENPPLVLAQILELIHKTPSPDPAIHETAVIDSEARLAENVTIGANCVIGTATLGAGARICPGVYIGDDVVVGAGTQIGPNCVLMEGTRLGDDVILQPGAVIGADGFGYAPDGQRNKKVPQVGDVDIGHHVEIGANTCVDRGALSDTRIGAGTKIDNLVQVAHGVQIGENAVIIAQVALGGDAQVGDRSLIAGQAAVVQHARVGADVRIGAQSGVTQNVPDFAAFSGSPAYGHADWLKTSVRLKKLDSMYRQLAEAQVQIENLQNQVDALLQNSDRASYDAASTSAQVTIHGGNDDQ